MDGPGRQAEGRGCAGLHAERRALQRTVPSCKGSRAWIPCSQGQSGMAQRKSRNAPRWRRTPSAGWLPGSRCAAGGLPACSASPSGPAHSWDWARRVGSIAAPLVHGHRWLRAGLCAGLHPAGPGPEAQHLLQQCTGHAGSPRSAGQPCWAAGPLQHPLAGTSRARTCEEAWVRQSTAPSEPSSDAAAAAASSPMPQLTPLDSAAAISALARAASLSLRASLACRPRLWVVDVSRLAIALASGLSDHVRQPRSELVRLLRSRWVPHHATCPGQVAHDRVQAFGACSHLPSRLQQRLSTHPAGRGGRGGPLPTRQPT